MPVHLTTQEAEIRNIEVQSQPQANRSRGSILKIPNPKKGWWCGSSGLPNKREALNSNSSTTPNTNKYKVPQPKKKKEKKKKVCRSKRQ
jgi:hypothetical protein